MTHNTGHLQADNAAAILGWDMEAINAAILQMGYDIVDETTQRLNGEIRDAVRELAFAEDEDEACELRDRIDSIRGDLDFIEDLDPFTAERAIDVVLDEIDYFNRLDNEDEAYDLRDYYLTIEGDTANGKWLELGYWPVAVKANRESVQYSTGWLFPSRARAYDRDWGLTGTSDL